MILVAYIAACIAFCAAFAGLGLMARTAAMLATARGAMATIGDPALDDLAKEKAVQQAAVALLGQTAMTVLVLAACLGFAAVPAIAGAVLGGYTLDEFVRFSLRLDVLVLTVAVFAALAFAWRRLRRAA